MDLVTYALLKNKVSSITDQLDGLTNGFDYKGSVTDVEDLPNNANIGDVYTVANENNDKYTWNGEDWVQIDLKYDQVQDELSDLQDYASNLIIISDTRPSSTDNKLWVRKTGGTIQIPTVEEVDAKQDAPSANGTAGQVLGLDNSLRPVWVNQSGGGGIPAPLNPSDGQFLVYSSSQSAWIAQTVPSANGVSF